MTPRGGPGAKLLRDPSTPSGFADPMAWPSVLRSLARGPAIAAAPLRRPDRRSAAAAAPGLPRLVRLALALLLGAAAGARATSVVPPSFPQLVAEADVIARGTVTAVAAHWVDGPQGRMIKTFVTFDVAKVLKGSPPNPLVLQFLGGTVGSDTLHVSDMPQFKVGETEILFVHGNGVQFCPLVRMMHGRYHVRTDAATDRKYITRDDDTPLTSVAGVQQPVGGRPRAQAMRSDAGALSRDDFEAQIAAEVARQHG